MCVKAKVRIRIKLTKSQPNNILLKQIKNLEILRFLHKMPMSALKTLMFEKCDWFWSGHISFKFPHCNNIFLLLSYYLYL